MLISEESPKNITEEKKQREQLLALNQVIAQQVMEKRKSLPGKYLQLHTYNILKKKICPHQLCKKFAKETIFNI